MLKLRNLMQVACMATAALTAFSCSQDEFENSGHRGNTTVTATFEGAGGDTRTTVSDDYKILWQESDALGLFSKGNGDAYTNTELTYSSGAGTTSATFNGTKPSGETASFSIYPYQSGMSVSGNTLTMNLPDNLSGYDGTSNGPMYAKVTDSENLNALSFKHMAAMIKLTVNKIPSEATTFKIIASNNIAGTCTADLSAENPVLTVTADAKKEITATFAASSEITSRGFYIPLPVGTYSSITAQLTNGSDKVYFTKTLNDKILGRRDLLVVPALDCVEVTADTPSALSTALSSSGTGLPTEVPDVEKTTTIAVSGTLNTTLGTNEVVAIPVVQKSNINLAFNTLPTTSTTAPLKLADNTGVTDPAETSVNSVSLAVPEAMDGGTAPSVEIAMASSTVTLAAVGETATFNEVTATTAKQTLIIDAGVTVKKLTVKGGNLNVNGKIEELVFDAGTGTTIYITKGTGAQLPESIPEGFVVMDNIAVLKTALANGGTYKLTTDADIRGLNVTIPEGKETTLDLNGYTLTADNSQLGRITVFGKLILEDNSTEGKGKIVASQDYSSTYSGGLIEVAGESASMTMESGNIYAVRDDATKKGQFGVVLATGGDFAMTGGKIEAGWFAVSGNGNNSTQNSVISITGGELISTADYAVYLPQSGTTTISAGKVYGAAGGVFINRGTLNVEGTALITSKGTGDTGNWGDGTGKSGSAAINAASKYGDCTVNIKGGTLTAETESLIAVGSTYTPTINITGGTFSDPSALAYLAENANVKIQMTADKTCKGFKTQSGQTVEMDLGSHTLTLSDPTVGSAGTETNSCQLKQGSTVIFKNGTLTSDNIKIMIQNYCNLTLSGMKVNGTSAEYVVSNNCGNVTIDNTTINAGSGEKQFAFDVCGYSSYPGVSVTVKGTSTINGKVEISKSAQNTGTMELKIEGGTFSGDLVIDSSIADASSIIKITGTPSFSGTTWDTYKPAAGGQ